MISEEYFEIINSISDTKSLLEFSFKISNLSWLSLITCSNDSNSNLIFLIELFCFIISLPKILKSIKENCEDKTIVLISHRKSTTAVCNKTYKLENSKLVLN